MAEKKTPDPKPTLREKLWLIMSDCDKIPKDKENKFDVEVYWSATNRWTPAKGQCIVQEDQTR